MGPKGPGQSTIRPAHSRRPRRIRNTLFDHDLNRRHDRRLFTLKSWTDDFETGSEKSDPVSV